ncbi:MAG: hypothetical protein LBD37_04380 [Treponema sp.]|nr:hypothetical protein [Treponema sp.]
MSVNPAAAAVPKGGTRQFTATTVNGTNSPLQGVVWSITTPDIQGGTSISPGGLLSVAA